MKALKKTVKLSGIESWKTFNAAKVQNDKDLRKNCSNSTKTTSPKLSYHKSCRARYTLKRDLEKLPEHSEKLQNNFDIVNAPNKLTSRSLNEVESSGVLDDKFVDTVQQPMHSCQASLADN